MASSVNKALLGLLLALAPQLAPAAAVCRLVSGSGLAFGPYDVLARAPRDSQVTVGISCEGTGTQQNVMLVLRVDQGAHGASVESRRMLHTGGSGSALAYGLYRDAARTSVWGMTEGLDTMGTTLVVPATGTAAARFTIYGRIAPAQDVRAGTYADAVQVTINY
jgi:spore coat protein U-like protein